MVWLFGIEFGYLEGSKCGVNILKSALEMFNVLDNIRNRGD